MLFSKKYKTIELGKKIHKSGNLRKIFFDFTRRKKNLDELFYYFIIYLSFDLFKGIESYGKNDPFEKMIKKEIKSTNLDVFMFEICCYTYHIFNISFLYQKDQIEPSKKFMDSFLQKAFVAMLDLFEENLGRNLEDICNKRILQTGVWNKCFIV